jgi:hypothetical protein
MKTKLFALLACIGLSVSSTARAALTTNLWIDTSGGGQWEIGSNWNHGVPSTSGQSAVWIDGGGFIFKVIIVDATTVLSNAINQCMTVSNLMMTASTVINLLAIQNAGTTTPLHVLNSFTVAGGGSDGVEVTNSVLRVDGLFLDDGNVSLDSGVIITTNGALTFIGNTGVGQMTVSDGTWLADLVALGGAAGSQGTLTIAGGTNSLAELLIGNATSSTGTVWVTGGLLTVTNTGEGFATTIGSGGPGQMTVSNGTVLADFLGIGNHGTLTLAGGTNRVLFSMDISHNPNTTGTVWITGSSAQLEVMNGDTRVGGNSGAGQITVSNGTWLSKNVLIASFLGGKGTLTVAGGTTRVSSNMTLGDFACTGLGIVNVVGGELDVTNALTNAVLEVRSGTLELDSGTLVIDKLVTTNACGFFIQNGGTFNIRGSAQVDQGTQTVVGGTSVILSNLVIGSTAGTTGTVIRGGGALLVTNGVIGIGNNGTTTGSGGVGLLTISNSDVIANAVLLGSSGGGQGSIAARTGGRLHISSKLASNDILLDGGTIDGPDATLSVGENHVSTVTISNGVATFGTASIGFNNTGTLTMPGGSMTVLSNMVVGDCGASVTGIVEISGGSLFVTNATGNAVFEIRNRSVTLSAGLLKVDKLVITNACGHFAWTGGALIYSSLVLDPNLDADGDGIPNGYEQSHSLDPLNTADAALDNDGDGISNLQEYLAGTNPNDPNSTPLRITAIARESNDIRVTWSTVGGTTNALQATTGGVGGNYSTNGFADIFTVTNTVGTTTNYLDVGGATNSPSRFYRIRLVP